MADPSLPVIYLDGLLNELPKKKGVAPQLRVISEPALEDVGDGELVYDDVNERLVLRYGNTLLRFESNITFFSYLGAWDFSKIRNSHWVCIGGH